MNNHPELNELREIKGLLLNLYILQKKTLLHAEAALYMGISESYLYKLSGKRKKIPCSCPEGKLKFYERVDLDAFMLSGRRKSKQEIINEIN